MKTLYRNFQSIFRRFPASIVMNVAGFSLALAAFIVIMMEVRFESAYDRTLKNANHIFMLVNEPEGNMPWSTFARPVIENLSSISPEITRCTFVEQGWTLHAVSPDQKQEFETTARGVAPDFFPMFGFEWIACDTTTFTQPLHIFIPESMALTYFSTTDLVGKFFDEKGRGYGWTIGGVYRDFPENCSVKNMVYNTMGNAYKDNWSEASLFAYLQLENPEKKTELEGLIQSKIIESDNASIHLVPYPDLPYRKDLKTSDSIKLSMQQRYVYTAIALLIILIAAINFTNFYTALAPLRVRSLNTQRVLGARRSHLVRAMVMESAILSFTAFLLALLVVKAMEESFVNELLKVDISLSSFPRITAATGALSILIGCAASLFPAFYSTSFQPALALKGNFGLSAKGQQIRTLLMGVQLTAAMALLIGVGGIVCQNYYMRHSDLGYDKDRIITLDLYAAKIYDQKAEAFASGLRQVACVEDVALSRFMLSAQKSSEVMSWGRMSSDGNYMGFICLPVSYNYLKVMGIRIIEGKDFNPKDESSPMIFNKAAYDLYTDVRVGKEILEDEIKSPIVGICDNFKIGSLRDEVTPLCLKVMNGPYSDWPSKGVANIRIREGVALEDAFKPVMDFCLDFSPERTFELKTQFQLMENIYTEEKHTQQTLILFCLLATAISLAGVFSMTLFECNYRRKEIGLRKIMGATTNGIIRMFFRQYSLTLAVSFIVAAPLGWYGVHRYLENFAYKTPLHWWIFALALLAIGTITLATVYTQCRQTAQDNPVNSIKTE